MCVGYFTADTSHVGCILSETFALHSVVSFGAEYEQNGDDVYLKLLPIAHCHSSG